MTLCCLQHSSLRSKRFRGVHPLFLILALAPISRGQNTVPVPFLGLSLLPNPTETLAMQASYTPAKGIPKLRKGLN